MMQCAVYQPINALGMQASACLFSFGFGFSTLRYGSVIAAVPAASLDCGQCCWQMFLQVFHRIRHTGGSGFDIRA